MGVISTSDRDYLDSAGKAKCNGCGKSVSYPFLEWQGTKAFRLCPPCCAEIKRGLVTDIFELAALHELRSITQAASERLLKKGLR